MENFSSTSEVIVKRVVLAVLCLSVSVHSPQEEGSSEPSVQSVPPSQYQCAGMQRPLEQRNSFCPQVDVAEGKQRAEVRLRTKGATQSHSLKRGGARKRTSVNGHPIPIDQQRTQLKTFWPIQLWLSRMFLGIVQLWVKTAEISGNTKLTMV